MTKIYLTDYPLSEGGHAERCTDKKAHLELFVRTGICTCVFGNNYGHTLILPHVIYHLVITVHPLNFSDAKCISLRRTGTGRHCNSVRHCYQKQYRQQWVIW